MNNEIIGFWKSDPTNEQTQQNYGNVSMEFKENWELIYTIYESQKEQKIFMVYEISGDFIITDQPSAPRKEKTKFNINQDGKLELGFRGEKATFIKLW